MATANDILKKNKRINGTAAATPAVAGMSYLEGLSSPVTAAPKVLSASADGTILEKAGEAIGNAGQAVVDYASGVGNAIAEGASGVWNALSGKKTETAAPAAETAAVSAPISYTANMGNTGMMTSSEYLADTAQSNDWYYNDKKDYIGKTKEDALRAAEQAKTDAKIEAEALFRQNASNYGLRGEQMLEQGLAGGGYSEFLEGKNMETRARNYAAADANALAEAQVAQQNYDAAMNDLNTWKKNEDDKLRMEKLELSEQVRAERGAKWEELKADVASGLYTVDQAKVLWGAYANVYGELTQAEIAALETVATAQRDAKSNEYYSNFQELYKGKGSKEEYIKWLMSEYNISEGRATDMANVIYGVMDEAEREESLQYIATLRDAVRSGTYTAANAEIIARSDLGRELTEAEKASINAAYSEYKADEKKAAIDSLVAAIAKSGGALNKAHIFLLAVGSCNMDPGLALEIVESSFDENGQLIKDPTDEKTSTTKPKNYSSDELLALIGKLGVNTENGEIKIPSGATGNGGYAVSWSVYLATVQALAAENGYTLDDNAIAKLKSNVRADGLYTISDDLISQIEAAVGQDSGQPQPQPQPQPRPEEQPGGGKEEGGNVVLDALTKAWEGTKKFVGGAAGATVEGFKKIYKQFEKWGGGDEEAFKNYIEENTVTSLELLKESIDDGDLDIINGDFKDVRDQFLSVAETDGVTNEAYTAVSNMFGGDVITGSGATLDKNTWRQTYEPGDNFTIKIGDKSYKVQSAGKADEKVQTAMTKEGETISDGEVFCYNGELYMKAGNTAYKVEGRDLSKSGYKKLWKAVFGQKVQALIDKAPLPTNRGESTGNKTALSIKNARAEKEGGTKLTNEEYVAALADNQKQLQRGYAHAWTRNNEVYYVSINGKDIAVQKGDALTGEGASDKAIVEAASLVENREVFLYNGEAYMREGDHVYKISYSSAEGLFTEKRFEDMKEAIAANAEDRLNYSDALLDTGSVVKFDGASVSRIDKIEGGVGDVNVTLAYGDKKYKLEVHAVLGASSEAVKAADEAGVKDGQIFAHHEDLYIYKVDDNGKKQAYRLGATDFFNNKDYDKFKAAVTGQGDKKLDEVNFENIYGNYLNPKGTTGSGTTGSGTAGSGKTEGTSEGGTGKTEGTANPGGSNSQIDFNTIAADDLKKYVEDNIAKTEVYDKVLYSEEEMKNVARGLGVKEGNIDTFLENLPQENGKYVWTKTDTKGQLRDLEGVDLAAMDFVTSAKAEGGKITVEGKDKGKVIEVLDLKLTKVEDDPTFNNITHKDGGFFKYKDAWYYGYKDYGKNTFAVYKVDKESKDYAFLEDHDNFRFKNIERGNANFESDAFGFNKSLKDNDNIRVEINGKTYHVQSGGEVEGDELEGLKAAAKSAGVRNREVFKYGDDIYMCYVGKDKKEHFYRIEQRSISFFNDDDKLSKAISDNAAWDASNDEGEDKLDHVTSGGALNVISKTEFVVDDFEKIYRGDTIKVELANGDTYKLKARVQLFTSSEAYLAAKDAGIKNGQIFQHGRDLYLKQETGVIKLSAVAGKKHNGDYEIVKGIVGNESVAEEYGTGYLAGLWDNGEEIAFYDKNGTVNYFKYKNVSNITSVNNKHFKTAFDDAGDKTVFTYGDTAYYKDGASAKRLLDVSADDIKKYYSSKPSFKDKAIEGSGMSVSEYLQKQEGFINITIGGKKLGDDGPAELEYKVGGKIAVLKEVAGNETKNVDIGIITDVFDENSGVFAKEQLKNIKSNEFFVVTDADGSKRIFIKSNDENGKIVVAELKITDATVKKNIFNAIDDKKVNENATSYTYNLTGNEVASKTGGGREFNYSDFT